MSKDKIKIEYVETELLKPYPGNPRDFSEKGKSDLKRSIKKFGWTSPLLVNMAPSREFIVLSGNLRLEVAKELGFREIPIVKVSIGDPEKEREILLRMNVLNGDWNFELLKDFDITTLLEVGFDEKELSAIWDNILGVDDDDFDFDKALQEIDEPKTKVGDIYQLGSHRLVCMDSSDPSTVNCLLGSSKVDMLYFDSPYNINLSYNKGISTSGKYGGSVDDDKSDTEYKEFLKRILINGLSVAKDDCHIFHYCDEKYIWLLQEIYRELGIENKRVCLWIKNNFNMVPQIAFNKVFEPCVYGTKGKPFLAKEVKNLTEILNKEISNGNRTIDDLLDILNIWMVKRLPANDYEHPTSKPPTLHEKPLRRCTKPGDVVLDLYAGGGSTMVACEALKRKCYMAEISPVFCDVIIKRFETLTGQKAEQISCGLERSKDEN